MEKDESEEVLEWQDWVIGRKKTDVADFANVCFRSGTFHIKIALPSFENC